MLMPHLLIPALIPSQTRSTPRFSKWKYTDSQSLLYSAREVEVPVCLVGNKQDLCHARQVCEEEGRSLAQENRCLFQEVSAAESYQEIANLFTQLIRQVMEHLKYRADRRRYSSSKSMAKLINNMFGKRRKSVWYPQKDWPGLAERDRMAYLGLQLDSNRKDNGEEDSPINPPLKADRKSVV